MFGGEFDQFLVVPEGPT